MKYRYTINAGATRTGKSETLLRSLVANGHTLKQAKKLLKELRGE